MKAAAYGAAGLVAYMAIHAAALDVQVQMQGVVSAPITREVVFVAANAGQEVLKTWERELEFEEGIAEDTLQDVPAGTHTLSAKTAWTLRVQVEVTGEGSQQQADFTGEKALPGGDLNGDNRVDALDFAILRYHWYNENSAADITGSGTTDAQDYALLKSNWYRQGDEP